MASSRTPNIPSNRSGIKPTSKGNNAGGKGPLKPVTQPTLASMLGQKEELYGYKTYFRELGYYLSRLEQYHRSLKPFDEAVKKTPDDLRALMGRARSRAKAIQLDGALDDIKAALALDPENLTLHANRAQVAYLCCEFEDSLVQNLRKLPYRKKPEVFSLGAMQCTDAIENCIGDRAGRPLRDHFKIIRKLAWTKALESQEAFITKHKRYKKKEDKDWKKFETVSPLKIKCTDVKSIYDIEVLQEDSNILLSSFDTSKKKVLDIPPGAPFPYKPLQKYTSNIENLLAQKYLDRLYLDKNYLKDILDNPGLKCPNYEGTKKIMHLSKQGVKMLNYKQELLRARRPFYFIKFQESLVPANLQKKLEADAQERSKATIKKAEKLLEQFEDNVLEEKTKEAIVCAEKLWSFCKTTAKKYLPNRDEYLKKVYALLGKTFLDLKRINHNQYQWDKVKRIHALLGIPIDHVPSNDSVLNQIKNDYIDYKKQIKVAEEMIKNASSCEECVWLYHELARYHIEIKRNDLARSYAKKCVKEALRTNSPEWAINGMMLMTRIFIQQHNKHDARSEVKASLDLAVKQRNYALIEYLNFTLECIDKLNFDELNDYGGIEKREQEILNMMAESGMKEEVSHLFRKMSAMPSSRRMSVLPGVKVEQVSTVGSHPGARKQSIIPKKKTDEEDEEPLPKGKKDGENVRDMIRFQLED